MFFLREINWNHQSRHGWLCTLTIQEMQDEKEMGAGKVIYDDYVRCLNKFKKSFGDKYITNISHQDLIAFDQERTNVLGRKRSRSTINNYNAALARVYNLAVRNSWIHQSQVITFPNQGRGSEPRPCFERHEIKRLYRFMKDYAKADTKDFKKGGVKKRTILIRQLLQDYVKFVICSGLRPGTEMKYLKWKHIREVHKDGSLYYEIKIEKGKTGKRTVIARRSIVHCLMSLLDVGIQNYELGDFALDDTKDVDNYVFRLPDGTFPEDLNGTFTRMLEAAGLLYDSNGSKRSLYSLRHTYATFELVRGDVKLHTLALNMGTSIAMLEKHYSHLEVWHHVDALSGFPMKITGSAKKRLNRNSQ